MDNANTNHADDFAYEIPTVEIVLTLVDMDVHARWSERATVQRARIARGDAQMGVGAITER